MSSQLTVAVIGCGRMGRIRALAAQRLGAEVRWVVDSERHMAEQLANDIAGASALSHIDELDWSFLDAVFICIPPNYRGPAEGTAIRNGVGFFVEKPVGLELAQMSEVLAHLKRNWVPNAVGYMNRYRSGIRTIKQELSGQKILGVTGHWINGVYSVPWWRELSMSGGSLNEQCTHYVDLARFFLGEIKSVNCVAKDHPDYQGIVGTASLTLRFVSGQVGSVFYSCQADYKSMQFRVLTSTREYTLDGWDAVPISPTHLVELPPKDRHSIFDVETEAFLKAIESGDGSTILCDMADASKTQAVLDAVVRAIETGTIQSCLPGDIKTSAS